MEHSYRIKANVGVDQMLNVNLKQDIEKNGGSIQSDSNGIKLGETNPKDKNDKKCC